MQPQAPSCKAICTGRLLKHRPILFATLGPSLKHPPGQWGSGQVFFVIICTHDTVDAYEEEVGEDSECEGDDEDEAVDAVEFDMGKHSANQSDKIVKIILMTIFLRSFLQEQIIAIFTQNQESLNRKRKNKMVGVLFSVQ